MIEDDASYGTENLVAEAKRRGYEWPGTARASRGSRA